MAASKTAKRKPAKRQRPAVVKDEIPADLAAVLTDLMRGTLEDRDLTPEQMLANFTVHQLARDIADRGSIVAYLDETRRAAGIAIRELLTLDPSDVGRVAAIQRQVGEYLALNEWINGKVGEVRDLVHSRRQGDGEGDPLDLDAIAAGGDDAGFGD